MEFFITVLVESIILLSTGELLTCVYEMLVSSLGWDSSCLGVGLSWLLLLPSGNYENETLH
jgi:hypothetical protein